MKFCKDCKWCTLNEPQGFFAKLFAVDKNPGCLRPDVVKFDVVSGDRKIPYCGWERGQVSFIKGFCGPDGEFWEPKV